MVLLYRCILPSGRAEELVIASHEVICLDDLPPILSFSRGILYDNQMVAFAAACTFKRSRRGGAEEMPFDRNSMAQWYARRHLETDDAIKEIRYLPEGAPPREIRFVEVNQLISESTPMEPIDYGVDIDGAEAHTLYVLDVTPAQWEKIEKGEALLPAGWKLENSITVGKR
jgi:hypothetical protein